MPDYVYLLENRLSRDQQHALRLIREAALEAQQNLFLVGSAVRDLTSGSQVRELEVTIQGNALKLKKTLEKAGAKTWAEDAASHTLFLSFPGTVRVDLTSAARIEYPAPGKPVYHFSSMQEALRHRDFTANSMAISLNEGSYGLLMDPLNGVADIESRTLRLASNTGFLDEPARLIAATRLLSRLSWQMDERTQSRYLYAKEEEIIKHLSPLMRSYETEAIFHEEDGPRILEALGAEGWNQHLFPALTPAKADQARLGALHDLLVRFQVAGVHPDVSAIQAELMTAKLAPKESDALKKQLLRQGFVAEWDSLDEIAKEFQKVLLAKENATPSAAWKLFHSYDPEAVLWLGFTSKNVQVQERYTSFLDEWPQVRQRLPYALMFEMRITPELPGYNELLESIFLAMLDEKLADEAELRAFLEPHSPPAPPPPVTVKRSRGSRKNAELRRAREAEDDDEDSEETLDEDETGDEFGDEHEHDEEVDEEGDDEEMPRPAPKSKSKPVAKPAPKPVPVKEAAKPAPAVEKKEAAKKTPVKPAVKEAAKPATKAPAAKTAAPAKKAPAKVAAPAKSAKSAAKPAAPSKKATAKKAAKPVTKAPDKKAAPAAKTKTAAAKPAVKKSIAARKPAAPVKKPAKPVAKKPLKPATKKPIKKKK